MIRSGRSALAMAKRLRAVGGLQEAVAAIAEQRHQVLAVRRTVVDDQDRRHGQPVPFS